MKQYDAIVLFSGGLDSLLSAKILERQGLRVQCLHFVTPFFGSEIKAKQWAKEYSLDVTAIDISEDYIRMLYNPAHGYGKTLNPCIDCKILMLSKAYHYMKDAGAHCIATGEVVGQRPMSQRKEALRTIQYGSNLKGYLLRPLTAKHLEPTIAEQEGKVDREQLYALHGRGRGGQMALAKEFGITKIPAPAGGCGLTVAEAARNYYPILENIQNPSFVEFALARFGRQLWSGKHWLILARNSDDSDAILQYASEDDYYLEFTEHRGSTGLAKHYDDIVWTKEQIISAIYRLISVSSKVSALEGEMISVCVTHKGVQEIITVLNTIEAVEASVQKWKVGIWESMKKKAHLKGHIVS